MKIINEKKYFEQFFTDTTLEQNKIIESALRTALDTRKFEIELYWKRATYFWAFIAAMFVAYFTVYNSDKINEIKGITILISALGYFFSLGWYFVNRGSKYWQENWEAHVDLLGQNIQGNLFTTIKKSNENFLDLSDAYPFSVSRVNQFLSIIMSLTWFGLFIFSILFSFNKLVYFESNFYWFFFSLITILLILTIVFFNFSKSFILRRNKKKKILEFYIK